MVNRTKKLENLQMFHHGMKEIGARVATFDFEYNDISCSCIFQADYDKGFSLNFFKLISGDSLELKIHPGYRIDTFIEDEELYKKFWKFFDMKVADGGFTMRSFVENLDHSIPQTFNPDINIDRPVIAKKYDVEEKERPYFLGFKNWEVLRLKNPNLKGKRSKENLEKTQNMYPLIYEAIKDFDISVLYTDRDIKKDTSFKSILKESKNTI